MILGVDVQRCLKEEEEEEAEETVVADGDGDGLVPLGVTSSGSFLADLIGVISFLALLLPLALSVVLPLASLLMGLVSLEEEGQLGEGEGEGWGRDMAAGCGRGTEGRGMNPLECQLCATLQTYKRVSASCEGANNTDFYFTSHIYHNTSQCIQKTQHTRDH